MPKFCSLIKKKSFFARSKKHERKEPVDFEPGNDSGKYADEAIDNLILGITRNGGAKKNLIAKLVGGAAMFQKLINTENGIGHQNIEAARERLTELGIRIDKEDTGGNTGKLVEFDLRNGLVTVQTSL